MASLCCVKSRCARHTDGTPAQSSTQPSAPSPPSTAPSCVFLCCFCFQKKWFRTWNSFAVRCNPPFYFHKKGANPGTPTQLPAGPHGAKGGHGQGLGGSTQERSTVNPPPLVLPVSPFPPVSPRFASILETGSSLVRKLWSPAIHIRVADDVVWWRLSAFTPTPADPFERGGTPSHIMACTARPAQLHSVPSCPPIANF